MMKRSLSWTIGTDLEIDSIDDLDGEKAKQIHRRYGLQQFWHHQQISKQSCWLRTILEKFAADIHSVENKGFFCSSDLPKSRIVPRNPVSTSIPLKVYAR